MRQHHVTRFQRLLTALTLIFFNLSQPAFGMRVQAAAQNGLEERLTNALRRPGTGLEETPPVDWKTVARLVDALEWYLGGESELRQTLHEQIEAGISEQGALDDVRQALEDQDPDWLRTELGEVLEAVNAKVQKGYAGFLVYQIEQIFRALPAGAKSLLPDLGQMTPPDQVARNVQVWAALLHTLSAMPEWMASIDPLGLQHNKKFLDAQQAGFDIRHLRYLLKPLNGIPDHDIVMLAELIFDELAQNPDGGQDIQRLLEVVQKRRQASAQSLDEPVIQTLITRAKRLVGLPTTGLEEHKEDLRYREVIPVPGLAPVEIIVEPVVRDPDTGLGYVRAPSITSMEGIRIQVTMPDKRGVGRATMIEVRQTTDWTLAERWFDRLVQEFRSALLPPPDLGSNGASGLEEPTTAVLEPPAPAAEGPAAGIELPPGAIERPELRGVIQTPDGGTIVPELPTRPVSLGTEILVMAVAPLETLGRMALQIPEDVRQRQPLYVLKDEAVSAAPALAQMKVPFVVIAPTSAMAEALRDLQVPTDQVIDGFDIKILTRPDMVIIDDLKTLRALLRERGFDLPVLQPLLEVYDRAVQAAAEYLQAML